METLVATVLIVVVFMLASLILNNVFSKTIKNNTNAIEAQLNELRYLQWHNQLEIPYYDDFGVWQISIEKLTNNNLNTIEFEAVNDETNTTILKQYVEAK